MTGEQQMPLAGKIALVTGSGQGIGRATAQRLARDGADIVINYRSNVNAAAEAKASIEALGRRCIAIQANVSQEEEVNRLFAEANQALGPITILVNNAGTTRDNLLFRISEDDWNTVLDTNLKGAFLTTKHAARGMIKRRWGRIINITSVVGMSGNKGQTNYTASKAGLIGFTKSVSKELASRNVLVNAVAPGFIDTELTRGISPEARDALI